MTLAEAMNLIKAYGIVGTTVVNILGNGIRETVIKHNGVTVARLTHKRGKLLRRQFAFTPKEVA